MIANESYFLTLGGLIICVVVNSDLVFDIGLIIIRNLAFNTCFQT
jgi:hypothetical protein